MRDHKNFMLNLPYKLRKLFQAKESQLIMLDLQPELRRNEVQLNIAYSYTIVWPQYMCMYTIIYTIEIQFCMPKQVSLLLG